MLYRTVDVVATSVADCGCGEPHVLMFYPTVDVVDTAAIACGYAEHSLITVLLLMLSLLQQLAVIVQNPMF
jgi:hypothetical protein